MQNRDRGQLGPTAEKKKVIAPFQTFPYTLSNGAGIETDGAHILLDVLD